MQKSIRLISVQRSLQMVERSEIDGDPRFMTVILVLHNFNLKL